MNNKELILKASKKINQDIWTLISDIHDKEILDITEVKHQLITISGDLVSDIILKLE